MTALLEDMHFYAYLSELAKYIFKQKILAMKLVEQNEMLDAVSTFMNFYIQQ